MSGQLRVLLVSHDEQELSVLHTATSRIVGPDAVMLALDADSSGHDPDLAWGRRTLALHQLDADGRSAGPPAAQPVDADGDVWRAIVDTAHRHHVDLVAIVSHPTRRLHRLLKGSATHDMVEHADLPVLAVPESAL